MVCPLLKRPSLAPVILDIYQPVYNTFDHSIRLQSWESGVVRFLLSGQSQSVWTGGEENVPVDPYLWRPSEVNAVSPSVYMNLLGGFISLGFGSIFFYFPTVL